MKKGFTTAALGVAIVVFLTFGFMPGQVEPERWDCEHADAINTNPRAWSAAARLIAARCKGRLDNELCWRAPTKPRTPSLL